MSELIETEVMWKAIPGFERYEVSNMGVVRNIKTGRVMSTFIHTGTRVPTVGLIMEKEGGNSQKLFSVAKLVGALFVGLPEGYTFERMPRNTYKDGNPLNTRADNIEWVLPRSATDPEKVAELGTVSLGDLQRVVAKHAVMCVDVNSIAADVGLSSKKVAALLRVCGYTDVRVLTLMRCPTAEVGSAPEN